MYFAANVENYQPIIIIRYVPIVVRKWQHLANKCYRCSSHLCETVL